jgi:hypothetical protein
MKVVFWLACAAYCVACCSAGCGGAHRTEPTPVSYEKPAGLQGTDAPRGPSPVHATGVPLAEFCAHDPCETYAERKQMLEQKCLHAYAGPCAEFFAITYPTYPVEETRYYDSRGKLIGVRKYIAEHSKKGGGYGDIPACASHAEKVCTR